MQVLRESPLSADYATNIPPRQFKGLWMRSEFYLSNELTALQKLFATEIDSLSDKNGCWAANAHFAQQLNVTERHINRMLAKMIEVGLVEKSFIKGVRFLRVNIDKWVTSRSQIGTLMSQSRTYMSGGGDIQVTPLGHPGHPPTTEKHSQVVDNLEYATYQNTPKVPYKIPNKTSFLNRKEEALVLVPEDLKRNPVIYEALSGFLESRLPIKPHMTTGAFKISLKRLQKWRTTHDDQSIAESIEDAAANGWRTFFEPKNGHSGKNHGRQAPTKSLFREPDYNDPNI